jgi:hypothetical protein
MLGTLDGCWEGLTNGCGEGNLEGNLVRLKSRESIWLPRGSLLLENLENKTNKKLEELYSTVGFIKGCKDD